jgi:N-sulfoglucosamine sulfohydrolase
MPTLVRPSAGLILLATTLLLVATGSVMSGATASRTDRPNILWLIAEDFSPHLGCYGERDVATPNLDRFATEGMRFTRAFTTAPVCSASRSAFMTGMYQTTIGAHNHRSHREDGYTLPEGVRTISDWLRGAGYRTGNIVRFPSPVNFTGTGKTDWNFTYPGAPFDGNQWNAVTSGGPFYAEINFSETHRVVESLQQNGRAYPAPKHANPAKVQLPPYYPDVPEIREDWANYLDDATELDRKIGAILALLERDRLADNTIVVFMADHGQSHVRGKQWCYDSGLRVPLMVRWPKNFPAPAGFKPGTVNDHIVEAIDVTATLLAIAGVPKPAKLQGRALFGPQAGPPRQYAFAARDRCDETVFRLRTARDARYRYIRNFTPDQPFLKLNRYKENTYPMVAVMRRLHEAGKLNATQEVLFAPRMPVEELYDLDADPHEIRNLVTSLQPEHQAALKRLRLELEKWIVASNDQGRTPESPEVLAAAEKLAEMRSRTVFKRSFVKDPE